MFNHRVKINKQYFESFKMIVEALHSYADYPKKAQDRTAINRSSNLEEICELILLPITSISDDVLKLCYRSVNDFMIIRFIFITTIIISIDHQYHHPDLHYQYHYYHHHHQKHEHYQLYHPHHHYIHSFMWCSQSH